MKAVTKNMFTAFIFGTINILDSAFYFLLTSDIFKGLSVILFIGAGFTA